jgi:alpha-tubulin suppressor-like RCC1 family protein
VKTGSDRADPLVHVRHLRRVSVGTLAALAFVASLVVSLPVAHASAAPGTPVTWGDNPQGQLGDGTTNAHLAPEPVPGLTDVVDVAGGREHVVALRANGQVVAWGDNAFGQVGDGTFTDRSSPTPVIGLPSNIASVTTGHYHSMALTSDGLVYAWGQNNLGQLGDGTTTKRSTPVHVSGLPGIQQIVGGRDFSAALASDGTVWAWGSNANGECGDGTTTSRLTPVPVSGLTGITQLSAGRNHALALRSDGTVWAWGLNASGQLGDGTKTTRLTPVQVTGLTNVTDIATGADHSLAIRSDGTVWAWGEGGRGQLGLGTLTDQSTAHQVPGISNAVSVDSGRDHSIVIATDGTIWTWGFNDSGQVGDGTLTNRLTPFHVPGVTNVVDAGGGRNYTVVLESGPPDTEAPTAPGQPTASSTLPGRVDLSWAAATDDRATTLNYQVTRHDDSGAVVAGSVSSAAGTVTFTDSGGTPGNTYTYDVTASDGTNTGPASLMSDPVTVAVQQQGTVLTDDFTQGLTGWTNIARVTVDGTRSAPTGSAPSIRGVAVNQTSAAIKALPSTETNICYSANVDIQSLSTLFVPIRVRTAAGGPVARISLSAKGLIRVRNDQTATLFTSATSVPLGTWHNVGLCVNIAGAAGQLQATLDGTVVGTWSSNTGATPIGQIQIGTLDASTVVFNIDDVAVVRN